MQVQIAVKGVKLVQKLDQVLETATKPLNGPRRDHVDTPPWSLTSPRDVASLRKFHDDLFIPLRCLVEIGKIARCCQRHLAKFFEAVRLFSRGRWVASHFIFSMSLARQV
jgi:hypothetical protein